MKRVLDEHISSSLYVYIFWEVEGSWRSSLFPMSAILVCLGSSQYLPSKWCTLDACTHPHVSQNNMEVAGDWTSLESIYKVVLLNLPLVVGVV